MSEKPQLWVLAGGNGAGKSTFYEKTLKPRNMPFINADVLAKHLNPDNPEVESYKAAKLAADQRTRLITERKTFCFETVFSHPSKIDFIAEAKAAGYDVVLVYIHLTDTSLNEARVAGRVAAGGHSVPVQKIHERVPRTIRHISVAVPLSDTFIALDNSSIDNPFKKILVIQQAQVSYAADDLPEWAADLVQNYASKKL